MKKLFFFLVSFLAMQCLCAQIAYVNWRNQTGNYLAGSFFSESISSCPTSSAPLTVFYHDIPNNDIYTRDASDENGDMVIDVTDLTGFTIKHWPSGTAYVVDFCQGGSSPSTFGFTSVPIPNGINPVTVLTWSVNTSTNTVTIQFF